MLVERGFDQVSFLSLDFLISIWVIASYLFDNQQFYFVFSVLSYFIQKLFTLLMAKNYILIGDIMKEGNKLKEK